MVFKSDNAVFVVLDSNWYRFKYGDIVKMAPIFTEHGIAYKDNEVMYVD